MNGWIILVLLIYTQENVKEIVLIRFNPFKVDSQDNHVVEHLYSYTCTMFLKIFDIEKSMGEVLKSYLVQIMSQKQIQ